MKNQANDTNYIHQHSERATTQLDVSIISEGWYETNERGIRHNMAIRMGQSDRANVRGGGDDDGGCFKAISLP